MSIVNGNIGCKHALFFSLLNLIKHSKTAAGLGKYSYSSLLG